MIWTNSGDSHFLEPDDLWRSRLPKALADLTPHAEKDPDGEYETVSVDGQIFRRKLPSSAMEAFIEESMKPQGIRDARARLADLDKEGVWGEVIFPSLGMWASTFRTQVTQGVHAREQRVGARRDLRGVAALRGNRAGVHTRRGGCRRGIAVGRGQGLQGGVLADDTAPERPGLASQGVGSRSGRRPREAGMVIAFHIGTDPVDMTVGGASGGAGMVYRGPAER